jgi:hypothetical protein
MNIKSISNAVTSKLGRQGLKLQKSSPTPMFAGGVVGILATVVLASRATLKVEGVLDEHDAKLAKVEKAIEINAEYAANDSGRDRALVYAQTAGQMLKLYGPAVLVGAASIGLLTGSHVTLQRRNAGLIAAYTAIEQGFKEYRARVTAELGEDKDREFRYGTAEKEIYSETKKGEPKVDITKVASDMAGSSIYARWFDVENENWNPVPEKSLYFLKMHQIRLNNLLDARGHVFLNEVYDRLGMPRTPEGQAVGWLKNSPRGDGYIDFGIWDDDQVDKTLDFVHGLKDKILVDFNVDGPIYRDI